MELFGEDLKEDEGFKGYGPKPDNFTTVEWESEKGPEYKVYTRKELEEHCRERNLELIERKPNEVLLDLDTPEAYELYIKQLKDPVKRKVVPKLAQIDSWKSKSGVGWHVVLRNPYKEYSDLEAALIAIFLGSDPRRELLSLENQWTNAECKSVLFKPMIDYGVES